MARIEDAVNVGTGLAAQLRGLGIDTIEKLREVGAAAAWDQLHDAGLREDVPTRIALEGAVRGIRWKEIPAGERQQISDELVERTGIAAP